MKDGENLVPERHYRVSLLNDDLQKRNDDMFVVKNVKISPSGVVEADRVWSDVPFTTKIFYSGTYYITEMTPEEVEEFYDVESHDHGDVEDDE